MKIIALGANLPSRFGSPKETLYTALTVMAQNGIWPVQISRLWRTAPVPFVGGQPFYYNAVALVETELKPRKLLKALLDIEAEFGRTRSAQNEPRLLDLDLIAYDDFIVNEENLILPHPRMQDRAFVLFPMSDILDEWTHPVSGQKLSDLVKNIPDDQAAEPIEDGWEQE